MWWELLTRYPSTLYCLGLIPGRGEDFIHGRFSSWPVVAGGSTFAYVLQMSRDFLDQKTTLTSLHCIMATIVSLGYIAKPKLTHLQSHTLCGKRCQHQLCINFQKKTNSFVWINNQLGISYLWQFCDNSALCLFCFRNTSQRPNCGHFSDVQLFNDGGRTKTCVSFKKEPISIMTSSFSF